MVLDPVRWAEALVRTKLRVTPPAPAAAAAVVVKKLMSAMVLEAAEAAATVVVEAAEAAALTLALAIMEATEEVAEPLMKIAPVVAVVAKTALAARPDPATAETPAHLRLRVPAAKAAVPAAAQPLAKEATVRTVQIPLPVAVAVVGTTALITQPKFSSAREAELAVARVVEPGIVEGQAAVSFLSSPIQSTIMRHWGYNRTARMGRRRSAGMARAAAGQAAAS